MPSTTSTAMDQGTSLRGACSCGRNHYLISVPSNPFESLQVLYDDRAEHTRALSIRVPLTQIQSTTYAFYPEETHSSIRRVFTPHHAPQTKRHFCGFCGTPLSYWSEENPEEAEWVLINLNSLKKESVETLEDAGFLSTVADNENEKTKRAVDRSGSRQVTTKGEGRELSGTPWFEEMIEGSELGRIKRRKGGGTSSDGKIIVEFEVTEFESGDGDGIITGNGKRKLGSLGDGDDVEMRSGD